VAIVALGGIAAGVAYAQTIAMAGATIKVPEKAEDFRLVDQNSKAHLLSYYKNSPALVIISAENGAKAIRDAAPAIKALQASFKDKEVPVFLLNSNPNNNRDTIAADMKAAGLDIPVLIDDSQLIGEALGVTRIAQAFVIQPKTMKIVYSGPIADSAAKKTYVADAVSSLVEGKAVRVSTAKLDTAKLAFPLRDKAKEFTKISYEKEISPILAKNCVACHSEGGIGPFAMDSYEKVKGFSGMIREAVRTDRMPPYNADPHVGKFQGDMNLTDADQQTLVHWIEAGAPRGEGSDPLKINAKPAPEWELGQPDYIITLPAADVPASGIVDYQNPRVANTMPEGRWLRASQVKAGDRRAVHHLLSNGVGGYAVGAETTVYPDGTGTWVDAKQTFQFQMHYTPYGKATTDVTRVGLYFYPKDKPPTILRRNAVIANAGISIPPNQARWQETAYITFPQNATLYSVFPHAHYRGENMEVSIRKPGSDKEELIVSLPKYDFNWQRGYEFATPLKIVAGTKLITRYQYDNSKNNPANPDPNITVTWGEQSHEEMQYTALGFRWDDETVDNRKDDYQKALEASRNMGIMDTNIDGKVAKSEVRGRMATRLLAAWDQLDANKDGFLVESELASVASIMQRSINAAQAQQSVGQ
jgi:peroxiredoxin